MFGRKEIINVVEELQSEVALINGDVNSAVTAVESLKTYIDDKFESSVQAIIQYNKAMERRVINDVKQLIGEANNPKNVILEIENNEKEKEIEREIESIKLGFSEVYANVSKYEMIKGGSFTKKGITTYKLLNGLITRVAKLHGSNSINKIARREIYDKFSKEVGVTEVVKIAVAPYTSGTVFADLFEKGLVGKYVEYIEENYVDRIKRHKANQTTS